MKRRNFVKGSAIIGASIASNNILQANSGLLASKNERSIHRVLNADRTKVGTLPILRAFAGNHLDHVSPFVLLDEFGPVTMEPEIDPLRVDAHPHAGVIPTTYFLSGSGHHKDSLNYDFQIAKGEFMMFSSGKGAIHMEETGTQLYKEGGQYHGFQIWLNMPSKYKMIDPTTSVYNENHMDELDNKDYTAKVILGELFEAKSDIKLLSPAFYYHIKLKENGKINIPSDPTHNLFIYMINGDAETEGRRKLKENQIALYKRDGSDVNIYSECGAEFLCLGGKPLDEEVYSYGPFVMNTKEQINQCIQNYNTGKMGNPDLVN